MIMVICVLELTVRQNTNVDVIYYYLQKFAWAHQNIYDAVSVSKLLILAIAEFDFSYG